MPNITQVYVKSLAGSAPGFYWDTRLKGFAVRVLADGSASYYVKFRIRPSRKQKKHCIGPASLLKADQARERAAEILAQAQLGRDILAEARRVVDTPTVADLAARHLEECKPPQVTEGTWKNYECTWRVHIVPALGTKKVADLTASDVRRLLDSVPTKGAASNAVALLSNALNACERFKPTPWRPKYSNPIIDMKFGEPVARDRILTEQEMQALVAEVERFRKRHQRKDLASLFVLLLITGLRLREWMSAEWSHINWETKTLKLIKTKNGKQRIVPLSDQALYLLNEIRSFQVPAAQWIFPARDGRGPQRSAWHYWSKILENAGIEDFRCHDLRHTAASYAHAFGGLSHSQVQQMLGHASPRATGRYLNLTDKMRREGAEKSSDAILAIALRK